MAKSPKVKISLSLLSGIAAAMAANTVFYVTKDEAEKAGLSNNPPLIEVNTSMIDPSDVNKIAARLTDAGNAYIASKTTNKAAEESTSEFEIMTGVTLPPSKRGNRGGGAPNKYPFDKLEVGQTFFVPVSEKHPNPVKTLGSTVSSANHRYVQETGETKTVTRTKRGAGNKAVVENGQKVKETVTVPVLKFTRKFTIRAVAKGQAYGSWTAPADGALIGREA